MTRRPRTETSCPVPLDLVALLLRCDDARLGATVERLPEPQRAALASYCFERYHLRRIGLAIAFHCSERSLLADGGAARRHLLELARNAAGVGHDAPARNERETTLVRAA